MTYWRVTWLHEERRLPFIMGEELDKWVFVQEKSIVGPLMSVEFRSRGRSAHVTPNSEGKPTPAHPSSLEGLWWMWWAHNRQEAKNKRPHPLSPLSSSFFIRIKKYEDILHWWPSNIRVRVAKEALVPSWSTCRQELSKTSNNGYFYCTSRSVCVFSRVGEFFFLLLIWIFSYSQTESNFETFHKTNLTKRINNPPVASKSRSSMGISQHWTPPPPQKKKKRNKGRDVFCHSRRALVSEGYG